MKKTAYLIFIALLLPFAAYSQDYTDGYNSYDPYNPYGQGPDGTMPKRSDRDTSDRKKKIVLPQHHTWQWAHGGVYKKEIQEDSLLDGFHISNPMFRYSQSNTYLAPLPSPYQSNIYILRDNNSDSYYHDLFRGFLFKPEDALLYNTTTPYSVLSYSSAGSRGRNESSLNLTHSQNIKPFWNAGLRYNLNRSDGRYLNQGTKAYDFSIFSNYDKGVFAFEFFINQNNVHINENGGISDRGAIRDTTDKADNILVNMESGTRNDLRNFNFYTGLQLKIGKHAYTEIKDTVTKTVPRLPADSLLAAKMKITMADSLALPVVPEIDTIQVVQYDTTWTYIAKLLLSVKVEDNYRIFNEKTVSSDFFGHNYISSAATKDKFHDKLCDLSAKIVINELPRHPYLPGIFAGADLDMRYNRQRYGIDTAFENTADTASVFLTRKYSSLYATAGIFNVDSNARLTYDASMRLCVAGEHIGNFSVNGYVQQELSASRKSFIRADASYKMKDVNPYWQYYAGNHDFWKRGSFNTENTLKVSAKYINTRLRTEAGGSMTNTKGYVWMDSTFSIRQETKPFSTYTAWVKQHFKVWKLHFVESVYLQKSMNEDVLSLPLVSIFSSTYIEFETRNKALRAQFGVDLAYDSKFYADNYRPSTMTFYNQRLEKQGNLLQSTVFLDLRISRCNIFAKYEHFDYYFRNGGNYFSAYDYPINPPLFRFGLRWSFFD